MDPARLRRDAAERRAHGLLVGDVGSEVGDRAAPFGEGLGSLEVEAEDTGAEACEAVRDTTADAARRPGHHDRPAGDAEDVREVAHRPRPCATRARASSKRTVFPSLQTISSRRWTILHPSPSRANASW